MAAGATRLAATLALMLCAATALAQTYPTRPIRIVVPYAAGSTTDLQGRMIADVLAESMGQPVIVENRAGASGTIGSERVSRAEPDGYTLVLGSAASHLVSAVLMATPPYDPTRDFAPVSLVTKYPNVVVVNPSMGVKTMGELIQAMRDKPGTPYGTAGPTTAGRLTAELLQSRLGLKMTMVPYNGSAPAMTDLVAGHLPLAIVDIAPVAPLLNTGKVIPLAVTSTVRSPIAPQIPTLAETGIRDFESVAWLGLFAPPDTPLWIREKLSAEIRNGLNRPELRNKIEQSGAILVASTPQELHDYLSTELAQWRIRVRENNIKAD
ncbi:MAG: tripartite tricarboxylate transporter substrate binding protein [Burkholderiales bacterium]